MDEELRWRWECPSCNMLHCLQKTKCNRCGDLNPASLGMKAIFRKTIQIPGTMSHAMWRCTGCNIVNPESKHPRCDLCLTLRPIFRELEFQSSDLDDFGSEVFKTVDQAVQTDLITDPVQSNQPCSEDEYFAAHSDREIGETFSEKTSDGLQENTEKVPQTLQPDATPNNSEECRNSNNNTQAVFNFVWPLAPASSEEKEEGNKSDTESEYTNNTSENNETPEILAEFIPGDSKQTEINATDKKCNESQIPSMTPNEPDVQISDDKPEIESNDLNREPMNTEQEHRLNQEVHIEVEDHNNSVTLPLITPPLSSNQPQALNFWPTMQPQQTFQDQGNSLFSQFPNTANPQHQSFPQVPHIQYSANLLSWNIPPVNSYPTSFQNQAMIQQLQPAVPVTLFAHGVQGTSQLPQHMEGRKFKHARRRLNRN